AYATLSSTLGSPVTFAVPPEPCDATADQNGRRYLDTWPHASCAAGRPLPGRQPAGGPAREMRPPGVTQHTSSVKWRSNSHLLRRVAGYSTGSLHVRARHAATTVVESLSAVQPVTE